jgi:hypothetical protein
VLKRYLKEMLAYKQAQIEAKPNADCHLLYLTFYLTFGEIARLGEIEGWLRTRSKQEIEAKPNANLASCAQPTFYLSAVAKQNLLC